MKHPLPSCFGQSPVYPFIPAARWIPAILGALLWLAGLPLGAQTTNPPPPAAALAVTPRAAVAPAPDTNGVPGPIIFEELLATNRAVLMTNAEFRQAFGRKLTFKSGFLSDSFDIERLHPSVLARLKLDLEKAKAEQAKIDEANQLQLAEMARRRQELKAKQALVAQKAREAAAIAASNAAAAGPPPNGAPRMRGKRQAQPPPQMPPEQ